MTSAKTLRQEGIWSDGITEIRSAWWDTASQGKREESLEGSGQVITGGLAGHRAGAGLSPMTFSSGGTSRCVLLYPPENRDEGMKQPLLVVSVSYHK